MPKKLGSNNRITFIAKTRGLQSSLLSIPVRVPKDGSSLFWTVVLVYLVDLKGSEDYERFMLACHTLFGKISEKEINTINTLIKEFQDKRDSSVICAHSLFQKLILLFRERVVDYMSSNAEAFQPFASKNFSSYLQTMRLPTRFAGELEIRAITKLLACNIHVCNQSNSTVRYRFISEQNDESSAEIRTLCVQYNADELHYFFNFPENVSEEKIDLYNELSCDSDSSSSDLDSTTDYSDSDELAYPLLFERSTDELSTYSPVFLSFVVRGISVGILLETVLWIVPASPLFRIFSEKECRAFSLFELVTDPYSFYRSYQAELLRPIAADHFLSTFLHPQKPGFTGTMLGANMGSLAASMHRPTLKRLFLTAVLFSAWQSDFLVENLGLKATELFAFFLEAAGFSADYLAVEKNNFNVVKVLEAIECQILALSLLPLCGIGLVQCFDFAIDYLMPTLNTLRSVANRLLEKAIGITYFFTRETRDETVDLLQNPVSHSRS